VSADDEHVTQVTDTILQQLLTLGDAVFLTSP
jgi:hypothetical protein